MEPITLSRHIDRIEAAGLIERRPHPSRPARPPALPDRQRAAAGHFVPRRRSRKCVADRACRRQRGGNPAADHRRARADPDQPHRQVGRGPSRRTPTAGNRPRQNKLRRDAFHECRRGKYQERRRDEGAGLRRRGRHPPSRRARPRLRRSGTAGATSSWRSFRSSCLRVGAFWFWLTGGRYASTDNAYVQPGPGDDHRRRVRPDRRRRGRARTSTSRQATSSSGSTPSPTASRSPAPRRRSPRPGSRSSSSAPTYEQALAAEKTATDDLDFKQKAFDRQKGPARQGHRLAGHLRRGRERPPRRRRTR